MQEDQRPADGNTDQMRAVKLNHLSPSWVEQLDEEYGAAKAKNGGYLSLEANFEAGKPRPLRYYLTLEFLPWRRNKHKNRTM